MAVTRESLGIAIDFVGRLQPAGETHMLPALEAAGFQAQGGSSDQALFVLTVTYAGVPCVLKLVAITVLARTNLKEI